MPKLRFTAAARQDLDAIYDYGFKNFGLDTADRYAAMLMATANALLDFPMIGTEVPNRKQPLRRISAESHIIYYRPDTKGVLVTRVLHQRMDADRRI
ncbi:MAG: type II toxin-antitoxin system RelE/ParE family toxin [Polymorphobacter sp.]|uniref:type II toxin-antitoxin system RelE/ParE family toxin n=1 Tax=Polymorphobacter sp. TaxID=1909290 RepID=UPI003A877AE8